MAPPETLDVQNFRNFRIKDDPTRPHRFSRLRTALSDSFDNPLGAHTTATVRDAALRAKIEDFGQMEGQEMNEANYAKNQMELARAGSLAEMTAPRLVQTGGSSTGTSTTTQPGGGFLNGLMGAGATLGSAAIM